MYSVIFYRDKKGNEPIKDYLYELRAKAQTSKYHRIQFEKITAYIKTLQEYGTRIGTPIVKHIKGDIWELRPLKNRIFSFVGKMIPLYCCIII